MTLKSTPYYPMAVKFALNTRWPQAEFKVMMRQDVVSFQYKLAVRVECKDGKGQIVTWEMPNEFFENENTYPEIPQDALATFALLIGH